MSDCIYGTLLNVLLNELLKAQHALCCGSADRGSADRASANPGPASRGEATGLAGGLLLTELAGDAPWPGLAGLLAGLGERHCATRVMGRKPKASFSQT